MFAFCLSAAGPLFRFFLIGNIGKVQSNRRHTYVDHPLKFKTKPAKLSIVENVQGFFEKISCGVLRRSSRVICTHFHATTPNNFGDKNSSGSRVRANPGPPYQNQPYQPLEVVSVISGCILLPGCSCRTFESVTHTIFEQVFDKNFSNLRIEWDENQDEITPDLVCWRFPEHFQFLNPCHRQDTTSSLHTLFE
jgi:hypothetical protein